MTQHEQQRGCFPAGRASPSGTGCPGRPPPQPGTGRSRVRPGFAGLWLLLIPAACCGGPLLVAALAAAGALAWGELGLAVAAVLAGALLAIRRYRRARAGSGASNKSQKPQLAAREVRPR
jgi:hypothetical protein